MAGIRIFSSAPDAPRARRPTDGVLLALAILGAIALSFPAPGPTALDTAVANLVAQLPGLVGWFWEISYDLLIIWSLCLLLLALFAHGRKRLFLYEVLAVALALGFAILASSASGTDPSTSLEGLFNSTSPPIYLATRIAVATAVIVTASPDLARPWRLIGRWLIGIGAVSGIALGAALPIGVAAGFLVGFASAALVAPPLRLPAGTAHPRSGDGGAARARRGGDRRPRRGPAAAGRGPRARLHPRRPSPPREGLRPRRLGRPARGRHLVRDLDPWRQARRRGPAPAGGARGVRHVARRARRRVR